MSGILYLIPTPIGNREDISLRALSVLKDVDVIAAEDTRHTGLLLQHYAIKKPLLSYQEYNELRRIPEIIQRLSDGQNIALVSDAGTPALSDPGFKLIRAAIADGITIDSLPGASSILVALVGSGLPTDKFYYAGFLPRTSGKRQSSFTQVKSLPATLIYFESPHRIASSVQDAFEVLGPRSAVIARELTKVHQEFLRFTLDQAHTAIKKELKGEIVLLIAGSNQQQTDITGMLDCNNQG